MSDPVRQETLEDNAAARPVCEHAWSSHIYNGQSLRICMLCKDPNWDDVLPAAPFWHCRSRPFGPVYLTTRAPSRRLAAKRYREWLSFGENGARSPLFVFVSRWRNA